MTQARKPGSILIDCKLITFFYFCFSTLRTEASCLSNLFYPYAYTTHRGENDRDVFNEKPSKEEQMAATQVSETTIMHTLTMIIN